MIPLLDEVIIGISMDSTIVNIFEEEDFEIIELAQTTLIQFLAMDVYITETFTYGSELADDVIGVEITDDELMDMYSDSSSFSYADFIALIIDEMEYGETAVIKIKSHETGKETEFMLTNTSLDNLIFYYKYSNIFINIDDFFFLSDVIKRICINLNEKERDV